MNDDDLLPQIGDAHPDLECEVKFVEAVQVDEFTWTVRVSYGPRD